VIDVIVQLGRDANGKRGITQHRGQPRACLIFDRADARRVSGVRHGRWPDN
jgi:hypothetical protein